MRISIEVIARLPAELERTIEAQHAAYEAQHGVICNYSPFAITLSDETGGVIGALKGYTAYAEIYVDDLWVEQSHRRRGHGRALLGALEQHFRHDGYDNINLVTNGFQAVDFYKKCGFGIEFVRENRQHPKLSKTFFIKYFGRTSQPRGIIQE